MMWTRTLDENKSGRTYTHQRRHLRNTSQVPLMTMVPRAFIKRKKNVNKEEHCNNDEQMCVCACVCVSMSMRECLNDIHNGLKEFFFLATAHTAQPFW